eukprot:2598024-Heterocapsa_arctica.AAC.1
MSVRRTNMCRTIADGVPCEHFRSNRGCGYAHTKAEQRTAEDERTKFVRDTLLRLEWPWYLYHPHNEFTGDGTPTAGPALDTYRAGDRPYQEEDPLRSVLKGKGIPLTPITGPKGSGGSKGSGQGENPGHS